MSYFHSIRHFQAIPTIPLSLVHIIPAEPHSAIHTSMYDRLEVRDMMFDLAADTEDDLRCTWTISMSHVRGEVIGFLNDIGITDSESGVLLVRRNPDFVLVQLEYSQVKSRGTEVVEGSFIRRSTPHVQIPLPSYNPLCILAIHLS